MKAPKPLSVGSLYSGHFMVHFVRVPYHFGELKRALNCNDHLRSRVRTAGGAAKNPGFRVWVKGSGLCFKEFLLRG